jgi:hypothetical protein
VRQFWNRMIELSFRHTLNLREKCGWCKQKTCSCGDEKHNMSSLIFHLINLESTS